LFSAAETESLNGTDTIIALGCLPLDEPAIGLAPNLVEQNVTAALYVADRIVPTNNGQSSCDELPDGAHQAPV